MERETKQQIVTRWTETARKLLIGHKITGVGFAPTGDIIIELDNDLFIIPTSDPEGNGPGSLYIGNVKNDTFETIPSLENL
jgi:hypothetical protein